MMKKNRLILLMLIIFTASCMAQNYTEENHVTYENGISTDSIGSAEGFIIDAVDQVYIESNSAVNISSSGTNKFIVDVENWSLADMKFNTATAIKTSTLATNTLSLSAWDVDGAAYLKFITFTAGNTPTMSMPNIPEIRTSKILYIDPSTKVISYGDSASASGGGGSYTATNGLTLTGTAFELGGELTKETTISGLNHDLYLQGIGGSVSSQSVFSENNIALTVFNTNDFTPGDGYGRLQLTSTYVQLFYRTTGGNNYFKSILFSDASMEVRDDVDLKGLENFADYSANTTARSLLDSAQIADMIATGGGGLWTKSGTNLSPTTPGDVILLPQGDGIQFGTGGNYIQSNSAGNLTTVAGGSNIMIAETDKLTFYQRITPSSSNAWDIGESGKPFKDIYSFKYYVGGNAMYISNDANAFSFTDVNGTTLLADLVGSGVGGDTVSIGQIATIHEDTIPAFVFGGYAPTTSIALGVLGDSGNDTLYSVQVHEIVVSTGAVSVDYNIYYNTTYNANGATQLFTSDRAINATTTKNTVTTINTRKIPPNSVLWAKLTDATTSPDEIYIQLDVQTISAH